MNKMKRVLLLGDSIRISYQDEVRFLLSDRAFVFAPNENGMHTVNLLLRMYEWVIPLQPDVIHLNAGLWDVRRVIRGKPGPVVPLAAYRDNVRRLLTTLREETSAHLIWATTTPVIDARMDDCHRRNGMAGRDPRDIVRYNEAAVEEARALGAGVNDLHGAVQSASPEALLQEDGTHFNPKGVSVLAKKVADAVGEALR